MMLSWITTDLWGLVPCMPGSGASGIETGPTGRYCIESFIVIMGFLAGLVRRLVGATQPHSLTRCRRERYVVGEHRIEHSGQHNIRYKFYMLP